MTYSAGGCAEEGYYILGEEVSDDMPKKGVRLVNIYGYFEAPGQTEPAFDPGLDIECPVCEKPVGKNCRAVCFMVPGDKRSYFYRMHKNCLETCSPELETNITSVIVDAICQARETN